MKKFFIAVLALTILTLSGCAGMAISQGDDSVKMKHYYNAARSYITALYYDGNNTEVKVKLANIASEAYDEKLATAQSYDNDDNTELAYKNYSELATLIDDLNKYIDVNFTTINARAKTIALGNKLSAQYYAKAEKAFYNDDFYNAIENYTKTLTYTKPYKDATDKLAESYYRQGKNLMYNGNYRQAVVSFDKANQVIYGYKDSKQLSDTCKQLANEAEAKVHYTNAIELGGREKYAEAIAEFRKANLFVPHYKNSDDLIKTYTRMMNEKEAEEHYESGLELMANENYKEAKGKFERVIALVGDYKNARKYLNNCKQKLGENTQEENKTTTGEKDKKVLKKDNKEED